MPAARSFFVDWKPDQCAALPESGTRKYLPSRITHPMNPHKASAFANLTEIARVHCHNDEDAAQLARFVSEQISQNPALIIGGDIILSLEEFVGYVAQEMKHTNHL